jgi:hypothetical protein
MQFIHLTTTSLFLLALTHAAPASNPIADLRLMCEILPDQCPTAILEALENLPVNASVTVAPSYISSPTTTSAPEIEISLGYISPLINTPALAMETSITVTPKI